MSATSRLPACHTTWQLFLRTVPKLLLFLPSIVNMLPIFPGESAFSQASSHPIQHSRSPSPRPYVPLPRASTRLHTPRTLAPTSAPSTCASIHAASLLGLCAAILGETGLGAGLKTRKRSTQIGEGGGRRENETPATGEGVRMRCRQVSVDKHKARPASVCCDIRRNRAQTWPKTRKRSTVPAG